MAYRKEQKQDKAFSKISISLASPEDILDRSSAEVLKPRTLKQNVAFYLCKKMNIVHH